MDTDKTVTGTFEIDPAFDYNFKFETDGDGEGWVVDNKGTAEIAEGKFKYTAEAEKFAKLNLENFTVPAADYNSVEIKLNNGTGTDDGDIDTDVRLNFSNGEGGTNSSIGVMGPNDNTIVLPLEGKIGWTGDVEGISLRFSLTADKEVTDYSKSTGGLIAIDNIRFYYDPSLSNNEIAKDNVNLRIFPNPVADYLTVETPGKVVSLEVYNVSGQVVMSAKGQSTIKTSSLSSGLYILKVTEDNGASSTKRFIKK